MLDGYFISGTDTGVGKTFVASILVNKFNGIYYKPIQCGLDKNGKKDSDIVEENCKKKKIIKETYFFKKALSPNIAADFERRRVEMKSFKKIIYNLDKKKIFIEGAGGLHVPLNNNETMIDLIGLMDLPVILVCRTKLGTINHTLLSINLLKQKNIPLHGLVFNGKYEPQTMDTIKQLGTRINNKKINILAHIPKQKTINRKVIDNLKGLFKENEF